MWLLTHITAVIIVLFMGALAAIALLIVHAMATDRRLTVPGCPCCTGRPMESADCNCGEDCGVTWCLAPGPDDFCPWCDTHACLDRTMCNCGEPCGSWLCEAPAVTVDAEIEQWLKDGDQRG